VFREDELAVQLDIENPAGTADELSRDAVLLLDLGCQTGSPRLVVSTLAVGNSDLHARLPDGESTLEFSSRRRETQPEG
jgi:hypothetical protein